MTRGAGDVRGKTRAEISMSGQRRWAKLARQVVRVVLIATVEIPYCRQRTIRRIVAVARVCTLHLALRRESVV